MNNDPNPRRSPFARNLLSGRSLSPPVGARTDYLTVAIVASLAVLACLAVTRAVSTAIYPFPMDVGEGTALSSVYHASEGRAIYNVIEEYPFLFTVYNPLQIYLGAAAMKIFGPSPLGPRLLSMLYAAGVVLVIFRFVRRETACWGAAVAAALFWLVERHVYSRLGMAVVDFGAIFFSIMGLYVWRGGRHRILAVGCFVLAFFSKQSSLAAAAACFSALFLEGKRKESIGLFCLFLAGIAAGLALAAFLFGGAYFVNTFQYIRTAPYNLGILIRNAEIEVFLYPVLILSWLYYARRALAEKKFLLPALYVFFALAPVVATSKTGSNDGYFMDMTAGLAIVAGFVWTAVASRTLRGSLSLTVLTVILLQIFLVGYGVLHRLSPFGDGTEKRYRHDATVREALMDADGVVFLRECGFDMATRARAVSNDTCQLSLLIRTGQLSDEVFVRPLVNHEFPLVLVTKNEPSWTLLVGGVPAALEENYRLIREKDNVSFYVPKDETAH